VAGVHRPSGHFASGDMLTLTYRRMAKGDLSGTREHARPSALPPPPTKWEPRMSESPFPYIVGMNRSGTTLLRAMLASHPDLTIPEEAQFRVDMSSDYRRYERADGLDQEAFLTDLCRHPTFGWWGLGCDEIRALLREESPESFADAMRVLFRHCARMEAKTRYGDKTPAAVGALPRLAQLFPEARFIHLIRDGRDVALSHVATETGIKRVAEVAVIWKDLVERGHIDGGSLGPQRYRELRYEQLVEDPEGVLRYLCEFIELDFDSQMLRYFERPLEVLGRTQVADLPIHKTLYLPPTKGLRDWHAQMSRRDVEVFEAIAGDLLEELGYERAVLSVTTTMRSRAGFARTYLWAKRQASRLVRRPGRESN
jgi:hypothetical protein